MDIEKLPLKTENLVNENVLKLGEIFPEILTEIEKDGKSIKTINLEKLKELVGEYADKNSEIYELTWAGKQNARRVATEPTTKTLRPVIEDSVDFENTENLYIEGDNLEVLKILRKSYSNSIKCIYIDPPYNTGKDFVYKDNFSMSKRDYELEAGIIDEEGNKLLKNTGTDGRFHSNWLNMMYPRLQLAYKLLKKDGVIFISIDDNEVDNLKKVCNEIFGENNFVGQFNWFKSATPPNLSLKVKKNIEYLLCYEKSKNDIKYEGVKKESKSDDPITKPQNTIKKLTFKPGYFIIDAKDKEYEPGIYGTEKYPNKLLNKLIVKDKTNFNEVTFENRFVWTQPKLEEEINNGTKVKLNSKSLVISYKKGEYANEVPPNLIDQSVGVSTTEEAGKKLQKLFDGLKVFDFPKPVDLIKYLLNFTFEKNDIVLDFFSGSGSLAEAVMELNVNSDSEIKRKFILVQIAEDLDEVLKTADQSTKITTENAIKFLDSIKKPHLLTEIGKERIRRAAKKIQEENKDKDLSHVDFGFRVFRLDGSNMKDTFYNPGMIDQKTLTNFKDSIKEDRTEEDLIYQVLLDMGIPISANIEIKTIQDKKVFVVNSGWLVGCFDQNIDLNLIRELAEIKSEISGLKPKFVFRESSFKNDSEMINTMEYLKTKLFKTDAELKSNVKVI